MIDRYYIGWVRDGKGKVLHRPRKSIANTVTAFGGGMIDQTDGLNNTQPHIVYCYE